ncbi:winged helix-turn-helix domain-containing protein [Sphaerimonospora thailandensis]|uniref:Transcriptional regulator n=1 Tax=Sphaerimonospora thailandensis TaxID=795644 RepID=A0A8J3RA27_9ACTN|nr:helix-turn-helix domain-containing protein [Sphaerimonospora thailandensis]GIH72176.1 transcriptional regulator [Sphaerimonospora thailandensis]
MDREVFQVRDPRTLKAVAHPLRVRLLGALRTYGPATATELGARLGESSGSTSYHLRQLARYGFVEQDPEQRDRRERRWRAVHMLTSWSDAEMSATAEGRDAAAFLRRRQLDVFITRVEAFERQRESWSEEWIEAAGMSDLLVRLSPAALTSLYERVSALLREAADQGRDDPDARTVSFSFAAYPHLPEGVPEPADRPSDAGAG